MKELVYSAIFVKGYTVKDFRQIYGNINLEDGISDNNLPYNKMVEFNKNKQTMFVENKLIDLVLSLRIVAKYDGDIMLLFYGGILSEKFFQLCEDFNVTIKTIKREISALITETTMDNYSIQYNRFIDIIDIVENSDYDYIVHLDADMWFAKDFKYLIQLIPDNGVLSHTVSKFSYFGHKKNEEDFKYYADKVKTLQNLFTEADGGAAPHFIAAKRNCFINKMKRFKSFIESNKYILHWGTDSFLFTYLINFSEDVFYPKICIEICADCRDKQKIIEKLKYSNTLAVHYHNNYDCMFHRIRDDIILSNDLNKYY